MTTLDLPHKADRGGKIALAAAAPNTQERLTQNLSAPKIFGLPKTSRRD